MKKAMLECASTRVLVADHTKFRRRALHAMCSVDSFDLAIVDSGTTSDEIGMLLRAGVEVRVAPVRSSPKKYDGEGAAV